MAMIVIAPRQPALPMGDGLGGRYAEATFSPCRTWRYRLTRMWHTNLPAANFIGLNPSTADETADDPTIRRCIRYARDWGMGGLVMTNLYGFRSTDPKGLRTAADPVGPENDEHLMAAATGAGTVVVAWGAVEPWQQDRAAGVLAALRGTGRAVHCLALTQAGQPRHPLYLRADLRPVRYE